MVNDRFSTGASGDHEFYYNLSNFAGAAQNFDGNGPYVRAQVGGGPLLVGEPNPQGNKDTITDQINYSHTISEPLGTQPQLGGQPPFKPDVRCYTNPVPDINGRLGQVGPASPSAAGVNP